MDFGEHPLPPYSAESRVNSGDAPGDRGSRGIPVFRYFGPVYAGFIDFIGGKPDSGSALIC